MGRFGQVGLGSPTPRKHKDANYEMKLLKNMTRVRRILGQEVTNTPGWPIPTAYILYSHLKPFMKHVKALVLRVAIVAVW